MRRGSSAARSTDGHFGEVVKMLNVVRSDSALNIVELFGAQSSGEPENCSRLLLRGLPV